MSIYLLVTLYQLLSISFYTGSKYAMLSMKVTLSMVLHKYKLSTDVVKLDDIKLQLDLMMRSVNGYKVKIYKRNK